MRYCRFCSLFLLAIVASVAFGQNTKQAIQQAIEAKYAVTKPTADHKDMVTAGAVIDLSKDNLIMYSTDSAIAANVTYKGGKFEASGATKFQGFSNKFSSLGKGPSTANRTFVAGEKFWLISVNIRDDGAVLEFLSDPISDVRYKAFVKYPFPPGGVPAADVMMTMIGETIKAEPMDDKGGGDKGGGNQGAQQQAPAAPAEPPPAKMADIPPPPPPADTPPPQPKTIALGQTKDEVTANFGAPTKVVNLGTKEIDYYPDMKVTFVKGKVTDVQ
jgi:hypothetical protein